MITLFIRRSHHLLYIFKEIRTYFGEKLPPNSNILVSREWFLVLEMTGFAP